MMANFLMLTIDDEPMGVAQWNGDTVWQFPEGCAKIVQFDGAFYPGGIWDNRTLTILDPDRKPDEPTTAPAAGEVMRVIE